MIILQEPWSLHWVEAPSDLDKIDLYTTTPRGLQGQRRENESYDRKGKENDLFFNAYYVHGLRLGVVSLFVHLIQKNNLVK